MKNEKLKNSLLKIIDAFKNKKFLIIFISSIMAIVSVAIVLFTILPTEQEFDFSHNSESFYYNGNPIEFYVTNPTEGVEYTYTFNGETTLPVQIGQYTVIITGAKGNIIQTKTFSINIIQMALIFETLDSNPVYDGNTHSIRAFCELSDAEITYTYNGNSALPVNAGNYTVIARIENDICITSATTIFTIDKKPVNVVLEDAEYDYDGQVKTPVPTVENLSNLNYLFYYNGFVTTFRDANVYEDVVAVLDEQNYSGTSLGATITINKAQTQMQLNTTTFTYSGENLDISNSIEPSNLTYQVMYKKSDATIYSSSKPIDTGEYSVKIILLDNNYTAEELIETINIEKKELIVKLSSNQNKIYGEEDSELSIEGVGLVGGDLLPNVFDIESITREIGENAGLYDVEIVGDLNTISSVNYQLSINNSVQYEILKKPLTITIDNEFLNKVYGETEPLFEFSADGFIGSDTIALIGGTITREIGENAGDYDFIFSTLISDNYSFLESNQKFTISKASAEILPLNWCKVFGDLEPSLLFNFADANLSELSYLGELTRVEGETVGEYDFDYSNLITDNYNLFVNSTKKFQVLEPTTIGITYADDGNGNFTATISSNITDCAIAYIYNETPVTKIILSEDVSLTGYLVLPSSLTKFDGNINGCDIELIVNTNNTWIQKQNNIYYITNFTNILFVDNVSGDIELNENLQQIPNNAFKGQTELTGITLYQNITTIGKNAFLDCVKLASINLPNSIQTIGDLAFKNCTKLTTITLPNNLKNINNSLFENCEFLTTVNIPNSVLNIGNGAFKNCYVLNLSSLPTSLLGIGNEAFFNNKELKSVIMPEGLIGLGESAFSGCSNLKTVILSASTHIDFDIIPMATFENCVNLESISLPSNIKNIGAYAFYNCSSLITIALNSVLEIREYAFNNTKLSNIELTSIQEISTYAFTNCLHLESAIIGADIIKLEEYIFYGCDAGLTININCSATYFETLNDINYYWNYYDNTNFYSINWNN